jgi:catechol 2,3-dioxygenase-like lactoylglutathione lyase family enzyme
MAVLGIAHIEIAAADPDLWAGCLAAAGFCPADCGVPGAHARGRARIRVRAEPGLTDLRGGSAADIALAVTDVPAAFEQALAAGARPVQQPVQWLEGRPGVAMARVAAPSGIRHTICGAAALDAAGRADGTSACFGLSHVTLTVGDNHAAARFYSEAFGFQESGAGELRSGRAAMILTGPCSKDEQHPAPGSIRHLVFRDTASVTTIPVCHISCAYTGITVTPAHPAADETWARPLATRTRPP